MKTLTTHAALAIAYGFATNISASPMDRTAEWMKLTPWVDGDYWEPTPSGQPAKYRQIVTPEDGARLIEAFRKQRDAAGANFRGLPIYAGHPDADPKRWPDERRIGGIEDMEAREDGLYVKARWNDLGEKNRAEGYLVYPSPAWPYDLKQRNAQGIIRPLFLQSVGMTNSPRISDVPAWTNSEKMPYEKLDPAKAQSPNHTLCHLWTPEERTRAFNARVDELTAPKEKGGQGLSLNEAMTKMRGNANDRELLAAMDTHAENESATKGSDQRSAKFHARIQELTKPKNQGGCGLTMDEAIAEMRTNGQDAALLHEMGAS